MCLGTKLLRIEGEMMLTKWIEGLMLSFYGWKVRVDGRDLIFLFVVRFSLVDFIPGPDKHLISKAGRIFEIKILQLD